MANIEYILTLQDKASVTMRKLIGVSTDTASKLADLQMKSDSLKNHTADLGTTLGGLKQKLDLLRDERDLIDIGDVATIKNYNKSIKELEAQIGDLNKPIEVAEGRFSSFLGSLWKYNQANELLQGIANTLEEATRPGVELEQSMADLSAITGIAGEDLDALRKTARKMGKESGLGAVGAVNSYKLLASQIDVSKIGIEGLNAIQKETITLSQAAGMSMEDAAVSLAGTINQFGLSADESSRVINVLAAGSKYGAAEVAELSQSFKVAGATASAAGLDVESTAGALEVLSKMNLKGAEAGTALRNVLLKMQTELGVDFKVTKLSDAMAGLAPKMEDATYMSKLFGAENIAAAQFLVRNASSIDEMTERVTDSNVAYEQASITTNTVAHKMDVLKAKMDNLKIGVFEATKPVLNYTKVLSSTVATVGQTFPVFQALGTGYTWIKGKLWQTANAQDGVTAASKKFILWEKAKAGALKVSSIAHSVYNGIALAGGVVMNWLKGRIDKVRKAMTGQTGASALMSAGMAAAGAAARVMGNGLKAAGKAFYSIPVVGWIAAAISAIVALFTLLWNRSEKFRGACYGLWNSVKTVFHNIGVFLGNLWDGIIKPIFTAIGAVIVWVKNSIIMPFAQFCVTVWDGVIEAVKKVGTWFQNIWGGISNLFNTVRENLSSFWQTITDAFSQIGITLGGFWQTMSGLFGAGARILLWPFTLLMKLFPNLGAWLEEKVWQPIKAVFEKIAGKLNKLIEPVKKAFGKLFKNDEYKDVSVAYNEGDEEGRQAFRDDKSKKGRTGNPKSMAAALMPDMGIFGGEANLMDYADGNTLDSTIPDYHGNGSSGKATRQENGGSNSLSLGVPTQSMSGSTAYENIVGKMSGQAVKVKRVMQTDNASTPPIGLASAEKMGLPTKNNDDSNGKGALYFLENINTTLAKMAAMAALPLSISMASPETLVADDQPQTVKPTGGMMANTQPGSSVTIGSLVDKIEVHITGVDGNTGKAVAADIRTEVEKALVDILNA